MLQHKQENYISYNKCTGDGISHPDSSDLPLLLVPDPFAGARKTPLGGLHYHLGADECCLALKVTDTEDASTSTHPEFG